MAAVYWYSAQTPAFHRTHLRTSRRVWRIVVLATHTPLTIVLPGPQPAATCVMRSSDGIGARGMASVDVAMANVKPATTNSLIIATLLLKSRNAKLVPFWGNISPHVEQEKNLIWRRPFGPPPRRCECPCWPTYMIPSLGVDRRAGRAINAVLCTADQAAITSLQCRSAEIDARFTGLRL